MRGTSGNASTSSAPPPVTRLQSWPPIGSGNHTSVSPCGCCSRQPLSCHERTDARRACRTAATLLGPAQPTRGDADLVDRVEHRPARGVRARRRGPGAKPQPSATRDARAERVGLQGRESPRSRRDRRRSRRTGRRRRSPPSRPRGRRRRAAHTRRRRRRRGAASPGVNACDRRPCRRAPRRPWPSGRCRDPRAAPRSTPGVSTSWRAARVPTAPTPATSALTGTRAPRARASHRWSVARHPCRAAARSDRSHRPSRRRGARGGRPSQRGSVSSGTRTANRPGSVVAPAIATIDAFPGAIAQSVRAHR